MEDPGFSFAELLRSIRARENLTQQDLADKLGCNRNTIVNWEAGKLPRDRRVIDTLQAEFHLRDTEVNDLLASYVFGTTRGKASWKVNTDVVSPEVVNVSIDSDELDTQSEDGFANFKIGNLEIPVMPILGSPQTPFRFHETHIHYTPKLHENSDKFPKEVKAAYSYLLAEITKKYNVKMENFRNNVLPRLDDAIQGYEREGDQRGDLDLYFSHTTYESLWATNVAVDVPIDLPVKSRDGASKEIRSTTLREYFCNHPYSELSASILSNAPGVEIVVISRSPDQNPQDQLIIRRRSQRVAGYRGWYQASASGHMSVEHVDQDNLPNPFITAVVEAKQEIADGLLITPEHFHMVGILLKWQDLHPAFHGYIETTQTAQELIGDFRRDSYEGGLFAIPFEPQRVLTHIATEPWFPISAVAIISALLAHFPRSEVEAAARAVPKKKAEDFLLITN